MRERENKGFRVFPDPVIGTLEHILRASKRGQTPIMRDGTPFDLMESPSMVLNEQVPSWTMRAYVALIGEGSDGITIKAGDDPMDPNILPVLKIRRGQQQWNFGSGEPTPRWAIDILKNLGVRDKHLNPRHEQLQTSR